MNIKIEDIVGEPYKVVGPNMIGGVCMCCFPGDSIFNVFPDLKGNSISHGICKPHKDRLLLDAKLNRIKEDLRGLNTAYYRMGGAA